MHATKSFSLLISWHLNTLILRASLRVDVKKVRQMELLQFMFFCTEKTYETKNIFVDA